ncbi:MAG: DUF3300 domain-containing protein [Syntrophobacter sp.]
MGIKAFVTHILIGFLILGLAVPPGSFAQSPDARARITQEELDQMLAPIALYPDSLLAQVLVAATYPEQVVEADQWFKQNSDLVGDPLNAALDRMNWDLSVKALVPFPKVLDMMSAKLEWTQRLGLAFLAQQDDVMDTVQKLRARAHAQGNLKSTSEQTVVVKGESVEIIPANPQVVYVPAYNPTVVYGPWWYPAYPPFAYSPYYPAYVYDPYYTVPGFIAAGALGFAAGVAVGSFWHTGWGHWDWGHRDVVVNVNRNVNINRTNITNTTIRTTNFNTAVRQGTIGSTSVRNAAMQTSPKRPTASSVQKGLQQRGTATRTGQGQAVRGGKQAGTMQGQAQGKQVRGQNASQRGQSGVARDGKAATRSGKDLSRSQKSLSRGDRSTGRGQERALRSGGGAGRGGSVQGRGAGAGALQGRGQRGGGGAVQGRAAGGGGGGGGRGGAGQAGGGKHERK